MNKRQLIKKQEEQNASGGMTLDDLYNRIHEGETQIVNLIVKADTTGSAEAIKSSLIKLRSLAESNANLIMWSSFIPDLIKWS